MTYYIYGLLDPFERNIAYVGKTKNLPARYHQHITDTDGNRYKIDWINSIKARRRLPLLYVLEETEYEKSAVREAYWIDEMNRLGYQLTNIAKVHPSTLHRPPRKKIKNHRWRETAQRITQRKKDQERQHKRKKHSRPKKRITTPEQAHAEYLSWIADLNKRNEEARTKTDSEKQPSLEVKPKITAYPYKLNYKTSFFISLAFNILELTIISLMLYEAISRFNP